MSSNKALYSWEFNGEKQRSALWYTSAISILVGLVIWGFLTNQYGMSFVLLLIAGIFYYLENNGDEIIQVDLTKLGIGVNKNFYDYGNIGSYTLIYAGKQAIYLRINLLKKGIRYVNLHIDNEIADQITQILPEYISENAKKDLSFSEKLAHWLKL
ncbi:hypothetical protein OAN96_01025 [Candidatus Gracilibacteria bacterium]|nr:hypothetical protein [Candidatus Gracilibacteria bacterium]